MCPAQLNVKYKITPKHAKNKCIREQETPRYFKYSIIINTAFHFRDPDFVTWFLFCDIFAIFQACLYHRLYNFLKPLK
jgi:hypothetical protein